MVSGRILKSTSCLATIHGLQTWYNGPLHSLHNALYILGHEIMTGRTTAKNYKAAKLPSHGVLRQIVLEIVGPLLAMKYKEIWSETFTCGLLDSGAGFPNRHEAQRICLRKRLPVSTVQAEANHAEEKHDALCARLDRLEKDATILV